MASHDFHTASGHFLELRELDPGESVYWVNYGYTLDRAERPAQAFKAFIDTQTAFPGALDGYIFLCQMMSQRLGRFEQFSASQATQAVRACRKAIELDVHKERQDVWKFLGVILFINKDFEGGMQVGAADQSSAHATVLPTACFTCLSMPCLHVFLSCVAMVVWSR